MSVSNLSQLLARAAGHSAGRGISFYSSTGLERITYQELLGLAEARAPLIASQGSDPDTKFLLHFDDHYDNITWFWAVVLAGRVPAVSTPLTSDIGHRKKHLLHLHTLLNPVILTSERLVDDFCQLDSLRIQPVEDLEPAPSKKRPWTSGAGAAKDGHELAALMLTSGSTGNSKAVMLRHEQMLAAVRGKSQYHETTSEDVFLNWIGFDHVANLTEIHLHAMNLAAEQIQVPAVDVIKEPLLFLELITKHKVAYTFAPNFFLASLRRKLEKPDAGPKLDLSSLRALISGGEANVVETCEALTQAMMQHGASLNVIRSGFGMTETCAGSIYSKECPAYDIARNQEFASLGRCIPGMKMRVVTGTGEVASPNEVGFLRVSGDVVFQAYYNNPEATNESFFDGWFVTGDMAVMDSSGCLSLTGRAKDSVNVNGVKYFSQDLETALEGGRVPGLTPSFTAVFPHRPKGSDTEVFCVVYLPTYEDSDVESRARTTDEISKAVLQHCSVRPYKVIPLKPNHLQKTSLGKLSRAKLRRAFESGQFAECDRLNEELIREHHMNSYVPPTSETEIKIHDALRKYIAIPAEYGEMGIDENIFEMGVTSVELLRLKSLFEEALGLARPISVSTMLTNSTIRTLAEAIIKMQTDEYDPVAILQPHGDKTPLWLVHPGVGEVLIFVKLARHLTDRPVYGLRAKGLDGEEFFKDIPEAVRTYHAAIRRVQPQGPYALAGYSYGSNLAFEVAKVLEAEDDTVKFLAAFDQPPRLRERSHQFDWVECLLFVSFFLGLISEHEAKFKLGPVLRAMDKEDALSHILARAAPSRMRELGFTRKKLSDWAGVAFALKLIGRDYDPSGTVATLDCLYAQPLPEVAATMEEWEEKHLKEWSKYVRGDLRLYPVEGTHYDMITTHVAAFQKKLKAILGERGL